MATFKTPGVFIEEIQTLAPSVAPVPTSIPGFVGYTEKAIIDGEPWNFTNGPTPPVRITSLLEFEQAFGTAFPEEFEAIVGGPSVIVNRVTATADANFILYYQMQMFFANGGGTCYVVSVGTYNMSPISTSELLSGIDLLEQIDEITLLVVPETVSQSVANQKTLNDKLLSQATKLQDRFAIIDAVHYSNNTSFQDASIFRSGGIGADNLKYGAVYYPSLISGINYFFKNTDVKIIGGPFDQDSLEDVLNGKVQTPAVISSASFTVTDYTAFNSSTKIIINGIILTATIDFQAVTSNDVTAQNIANAITANISNVIVVSVVSATVTINATVPGTLGTITMSKVPSTSTAVSIGPITPGANTIYNPSADKALYNSIVAELSKFLVELYPSASMAGVYARVDNDRGVWKAPANVGLRLVNEPSIIISDQDQEILNVDSVSGKSINAIRQFSGRGILVWGARTLAGNDNEWRYVNVRRLFLFVEESIKKATEFVVFEPNTASTWTRVRNMSEAFLTSLWRDGALAGATTQEAFFVRVGLGTTMTPQDILEGRMIVEIGLAASRPAEFIILRFSHKLQES